MDSLVRTLARINEINSYFGVHQPQIKINTQAPVQQIQQSNATDSSVEKTASFDHILAQVNKSDSRNSSDRSGKLGKYADLINNAASKYNIDSALIKAVITAESGGNPRAVSKAGAMGLMQLMPSTASGLGVTNAFDPKQNIEGGAKYLKSLIDRFGDTKLAIAAYNAGPGAVKKYGGVPPYKETQNYVEKVMKLFTMFRGA